MLTHSPPPVLYPAYSASYSRVSRPTCQPASSVWKSLRTPPPCPAVSTGPCINSELISRSLSLGHVFCYSCIVKIVRSITPYTTHHFCPTCRHPYTVGKLLPYPGYAGPRHSPAAHVHQPTSTLTWSRTTCSRTSRLPSASCTSNTAHRARRPRRPSPATPPPQNASGSAQRSPR